MNNGSYAELKIAGRELNPAINHEYEDAIVTRELGPDCVIDAILDGVSTASGKTAAEMVAERLRNGNINGSGSIDDVVKRVLNLISKINSDMYIATDGQAKTTATIAIKKADKLMVMNIGDSPAYLVRGSDISELTDTAHDKDDPRSPKYDPAMITNAVGMPGMHADSSRIVLMPGDILIKVTDGISDNFYPHELLEISKNSTPQEAISELGSRLKEKVNANKGRDDLFRWFQGVKTDDSSAIIRYF